MSELKPCPFCGGHKVMIHVFEYPSDEHERTSYGAKAICETCGARVESNNGDVKLHRSPGYAETSAINHWNTRANECDCEALLELADDLEQQQRNKGVRMIGNYMEPGVAAMRIRKALEEIDAN